MNFINGLRTFVRNEEGQDLLEYGLLAALIAIFALGAVAGLGNTIRTVFWSAIAAASVRMTKHSWIKGGSRGGLRESQRTALSPAVGSALRGVDGGADPDYHCN